MKNPGNRWRDCRGQLKPGFRLIAAFAISIIAEVPSEGKIRYDRATMQPPEPEETRAGSEGQPAVSVLGLW